MAPESSFAESFLVSPDLFPGRASGEAWGAERLRLDIAGGPYRLDLLSARQRELLARRFADRLLDDEAAAEDVVVRFFRTPEGDFLRPDVPGWELTFDLDFAPTAVRLAGLRFMARIDALPLPETSLWTPQFFHEGELFGTCENLLRVLVAHRVLEAGGVLLHSAAVATAEGAWLFVGRSGAGKTTLSRLSLVAGYEVLSDELNTLWPSGGVVRLERMPFAGDLGQTGGQRRAFPLVAGFALRQGVEPRREPLSRAAAIAELAAAAPFVNIDPYRVERLFENLERLCDSHPLEALTFAPDAGFWAILRPGR